MTKEQTNLFSIIAAVLMLVAFFFVKMGHVAPVEMIGKVGWFGTRWGLSDDALDLKFYYLAGYRDGTLKYDAGYVDVLSSQHIKYKMDTQPGYSGGPIYSSDYYAIGINIAENSSYNIGYRLTTTVKKDLDDL